MLYSEGKRKFRALREWTCRSIWANLTFTNLDDNHANFTFWHLGTARKVKTSADSSRGIHVLCMALMRKQKHFFLGSLQLPLQVLFFFCVLGLDAYFHRVRLLQVFFFCCSSEGRRCTGVQSDFISLCACCFSFINLSINLWPDMHTKWKTHRHIKHRGKTTWSTAK